MQFTISLETLKDFADSFWQLFGQHRVFAFHGEMGAGKTTIIMAICKAKGVADVMGSPTFSIVNEYAFQENGDEKKIYHIDLYRLKDEEEVVQAGVEDCVYSEAYCLIEWPEKAPHLFDNNTVDVFIKAVSETERTIEIGSR